MGIKIYEYVHEKGLKVSMNLVNFISDDQYEKDETEIQ